eukprot:g1940.t1
MTDVESLTVPPAGRALQEMRPPGDNTANQSDEKTNSSTSAATAFLSSFLKPHSSLKEQIASRSGIQDVDNKAQMYLMRHAGDSKREGRKMKELNVEELKRLEKVGRAIAKDKEAFDLEMLERRALEAREVEVAENMGYVMPTKEEREKIELRNSEEVIERIALQTLNKQFGKRLIGQRHQMKALAEEVENSKLDLRMLENRADEEDRLWKDQNLETQAIRWERHILLKTSQISKTQIKLDNLRARIDKHRNVCALHGTFVSDGEADIRKAKKNLERMTHRVKLDHEQIQDLESEIKDLSAELSVEVGHFKSGYRQRKNAFEVQNRMHKHRTFEEILHEDFLEDKITPAARRMMLKAAAQQMKLKRSKEMIVNAKHRTKKLEEFFSKLLKMTNTKDADEITDAIVESERRTLSVINQQQDLDIELQKAAKALHIARKMQADEVAAGSSAKMLARKRQAKAKQIQLSRLDRLTSKHTVSLERDLKIIAGMSKHIADLLTRVWPANDSRHYRFQQELQGHGGVMSVDMIQSSLGEIDQWIMTMKRVIKKGSGQTKRSKDRRKKIKKFTVPVAPSIDRFAGTNDDRPRHMEELKSQVEGIVSEAGGVEGMNAAAVLNDMADDEESDGWSRKRSVGGRDRKRRQSRVGVAPARRSSMAAGTIAVTKKSSKKGGVKGRRSSMKEGMI